MRSKTERTGKMIQKSKYRDYTELVKRVIIPSQKELNLLYRSGNSNVWFDYMVGDKIGRIVDSIILFVYTNANPKQGTPEIWQEGDELLIPVDDVAIKKKPTATEKLTASLWKDCDATQLEYLVETKLSKYLNNKDVAYYLHEIKKQKYNLHDALLQVIQVIEDKEKQPKFTAAPLVYKRKSIIEYVFEENLKDYGWSINPASKHKIISEAYSLALP